MDKELQNLQKRFNDYTSPPPEEAWEIIAQAQQKRKRIIPIWFRLGMIASVLIIANLGVVFFNTYSKNTLNPKLNNNTIVSNPSHSSKNNSTINTHTINDLDKKNINERILSTNLSGQKNIENLNKKNKLSTSILVTKTNSKNNSFDTVFKEKMQQSIKIEEKTTEVISLENNTEEAIKKPTEKARISLIKNIQLIDSASNNTALNSQEENQNEEKKPIEVTEKTKKSFAITTYVSPVITTQFSGYTEFSNFESQSNLSTLYGMKAEFSISPKWKIKTGLEYINIQQTYKEVLLGNCASCASIQAITPDTNYSTPNTGEGEFTPSPANYSGDITQRISYWSVPLEVEYPLWSYKKFSIKGSGGISALILNQNHFNFSQQTNYTESSDPKEGLNTVAFGWQLGLKNDWNLYKKVSWVIEPQVRYYSPLLKENNTEKPLIFTINTGVKISF